jgi:hypothetical protein
VPSPLVYLYDARPARDIRQVLTLLTWVTHSLRFRGAECRALFAKGLPTLMTLEYPSFGVINQSLTNIMLNYSNRLPPGPNHRGFTENPGSGEKAWSHRARSQPEMVPPPLSSV